MISQLLTVSDMRNLLVTNHSSCALHVAVLYACQFNKFISLATVFLRRVFFPRLVCTRVPFRSHSRLDLIFTISLPPYTIFNKILAIFFIYQIHVFYIFLFYSLLCSAKHKFEILYLYKPVRKNTWPNQETQKKTLHCYTTFHHCQDYRENFHAANRIRVLEMPAMQSKATLTSPIPLETWNQSVHTAIQFQIKNLKVLIEIDFDLNDKWLKMKSLSDFFTIFPFSFFSLVGVNEKNHWSKNVAFAGNFETMNYPAHRKVSSEFTRSQRKRSRGLWFFSRKVINCITEAIRLTGYDLIFVSSAARFVPMYPYPIPGLIRYNQV